MRSCTTPDLERTSLPSSPRKTKCLRPRTRRDAQSSTLAVSEGWDAARTWRGIVVPGEKSLTRIIPRGRSPDIALWKGPGSRFHTPREDSFFVDTTVEFICQLVNRSVPNVEQRGFYLSCGLEFEISFAFNVGFKQKINLRRVTTSQRKARSH